MLSSEIKTLFLEPLINVDKRAMVYVSTTSALIRLNQLDCC